MDWKKIKDDLAKGIKDGAETIARKTEEVSAEGQRKLKILKVKHRIQSLIEDLGAAMYQVESDSPGTITDGVAKGILVKIEEANAELKTLEELKK